MNLIEQSERDVIEKAKAWAREMLKHGFETWREEEALLEAVGLLKEREAAEQALDTGTVPQPANSVPPPRPGAEPITRPPKKLSKRQQAIEALRRSDPMGADRPEIDYGSDALPTPER